MMEKRADQVLLRGLEIECVIGVFDWERETKQKVVVDLEMEWDIRPAARDDDLEKAVDWKKVTHALLEVVGESRFKLVESLAERVAEIVVTRFDVPQVRVRLEKPGAVRASSSVGVEIVRTRDDFPSGDVR
jgi:dihydroneopterin aldolase